MYYYFSYTHKIIVLYLHFVSINSLYSLYGNKYTISTKVVLILFNNIKGIYLFIIFLSICLTAYSKNKE